MKYFVIVIMLFIIVLPITAEESSEIIKLSDFDKSQEGFSFSKGELVQIDPSADQFPMDVDFMFDMPNGLGMNNSELTKWFPGTAVIIDLGEIPLHTVIKNPLDGYTPFLDPEMIIPGHSYFIRTADSEHFGKIHIVKFDSENEMIEFTWVNLQKKEFKYEYPSVENTNCSVIYSEDLNGGQQTRTLGL